MCPYNQGLIMIAISENTLQFQWISEVIITRVEEKSHKNMICWAKANTNRNTSIFRAKNKGKKKGYNGEEYESNMRPAMLLHSYIKSHVYKSVEHNKNVLTHHLEEMFKQKRENPVNEIRLTQMFLLVMISTQKKQRQIFENFVTNLNMHNASWPKTKHQNSHNHVMIQTWNNTGKMQYELTIPVNSIDTIPDRPRPSASMYLKKKIVLRWFAP